VGPQSQDRCGRDFDDEREQDGETQDALDVAEADRRVQLGLRHELGPQAEPAADEHAEERRGGHDAQAAELHAAEDDRLAEPGPVRRCVHSD
jgi:hypothetical protein